MNDVTILDGSLGHELMHRGFDDRELWATQALIESPEAVVSLHMDYIAAGADVITTNTYSCVPLHLDRRTGLRERSEELMRVAAGAAIQARGRSDRRDVRIAGSLPPLDESYRPDLVRSAEEMGEWYSLMVDTLADHVDLWLCETMSSTDEAVAAATAALPAGHPVWVALTLDDATGNLRSGETVADAARLLTSMGVDAVLLNCCTPQAITDTLPLLTESPVPVGAYANAFSALPADFSIETNIAEHSPPTVDGYLRHAEDWVERGASIVGGCCGIGPSHIAALAGRFTAR